LFVKRIKKSYRTCYLDEEKESREEKGNGRVERKKEGKQKTGNVIVAQKIS